MQICHICAHESFYVCIKTDYLGTSREVEKNVRPNRYLTVAPTLQAIL